MGPTGSHRKTDRRRIHADAASGLPADRGPARARPDPEPARRIAGALQRLGAAGAAARFRPLGKDIAAAVFDALDAAGQRRMLEGLGSPQVQERLEAMEPDNRVRLLDELPATVVRRVLAGLSGPERELTDLLLGHPPESAGRIMSPEYLELRPELTVEEALETIRERGRGLETRSAPAATVARRPPPR